MVRNRRTRNVPDTTKDPLCTVVAGTPDEPEAFVCVPLLAEERVVGALNVYRNGADKAFSDAEVELVERFATMAALAYDSARQRETLREQVKTDGLTGLLNHRACQERLQAEIARGRVDAEPQRGPDEWLAQAHRAGLGAELEALAIEAALAVPGRPEDAFLALNVSPRALLSAPVREALPTASTAS